MTEMEQSLSNIAYYENKIATLSVNASQIVLTLDDTTNEDTQG